MAKSCFLMTGGERIFRVKLLSPGEKMAFDQQVVILRGVL